MKLSRHVRPQSKFTRYTRQLDQPVNRARSLLSVASLSVVLAVASLTKGRQMTRRRIKVYLEVPPHCRNRRFLRSH